MAAAVDDRERQASREDDRGLVRDLPDDGAERDEDHARVVQPAQVLDRALPLPHRLPLLRPVYAKKQRQREEVGGEGWQHGERGGAAVRLVGVAAKPVVILPLHQRLRARACESGGAPTPPALAVVWECWGACEARTTTATPGMQKAACTLHSTTLADGIFVAGGHQLA